MRITTVVLAAALLFSLSAPALAAGVVKVNLKQPVGSPEPAAKGFLKVKTGPGAQLFEVKAARLIRGGSYGLFLETGVDSGAFEKFGEVRARGVSIKYQVNTRRSKGPGMPQGATLAQMGERVLQVRNSDGLTVLQTVIPVLPDPTPAQVPALRILATDAPFPYENVLSAVVIVDRIELRKTGEPFTVLVDYPEGRELDLIDLQNGVVSVLFTGDPEPGDYDAMRVIVRAKEITVLDGGIAKTFDEFKVPSGPQTGIKIFFDTPVTVVTHLTTDLILDFDLARSFIVQGNPATPAGIKGFHFQPVLRVVNASTAGTLEFRVMSDNGTPGDTSDDFYINGAAYEVLDTSVEPAVVLGSGASGQSPSGLDGWVFHPAIPAGTWSLEVWSTGHEKASVPVTLYAANLTDAGTVVLEASSGTIYGTVATTVTTTAAETLVLIVDGATVTATADGAVDPSATDTTNTWGGFELTDLPLRTYTVAASKVGYSPASTTASPDVFGAPVTNSIALGLVALTADVIGTISDATGPVEDATVRALITIDGAEHVIAETTSGAGGSYTLTGLPTSACTIRAEKTVSDVPLSGSAELDHVGGGAAATVDLLLQ
jgi:hypothetical protein